MDNHLYIERGPEGNYAVRHGGARRARAVEPTQAEAIARAQQIAPDAAIHVERVRNTTVGSRDKWRKP